MFKRFWSHSPFYPSILTPSVPLPDSYLIGWYKNDEGSGSVVHNYATDGSLGGGLLPDLDVYNPTEYWDDVGFAQTLETAPDPSTSHASKSFSTRNLGPTFSFGIFFKINDMVANDSHILFDIQQGMIQFYILTQDGLPDYAVYAESGNGEDSGINASGSGQWAFAFAGGLPIDSEPDTNNILKIALADGSLIESTDGVPYWIGGQGENADDFNCDIISLGSLTDSPDFIDGSGCSFGDSIFYNNYITPISVWASWYDSLRTRYGMAARSWPQS